MKRLIVVFAVAAVAITTTVSGALATTAQGSADVCFLLPDPKTSVRWETQDRPAFIAAAKKAKVSYVITNADGRTIAEAPVPAISFQHGSAGRGDRDVRPRVGGMASRS